MMCSTEKKSNSQVLGDLPCVSVNNINNYEEDMINTMVLLNLSFALHS